MPEHKLHKYFKNSSLARKQARSALREFFTGL